ncbi:recombinase family protein [Micavibrio aeruginosavorus]|nr:recombinase family protein [Micavibrio aeruginosavorus]
MKGPLKNCAIYTRKSSDERLDMEFNSLDAQRESCLAFIASQKSEGWIPVLEQYDDGGFSGGNMDRPALNRLLEDIRAGKVHTVVVYKIDRLTRSLMDFSKLVEVFDAHGVTFVSITQSFNTTTSMGRLTLNVLLSFAQFEREVAGERIRDKIAASKRKGMWMGGTLPLGYDVVNRSLVVNQREAEKVQLIFRRYLELKSINELYKDLKCREIKSKTRILSSGELVPGKHFNRTSLHYLLSNQIYIGKIKHKENIHDGNHEPIISMDLWHQVQALLISQASAARGQKKVKEKNPLRGRIFSAEGFQYYPTYTNKPGRQYRYYQVKYPEGAEGGVKDALYRLPAHEIENRVERAIRAELSDLKMASALLTIPEGTGQPLLRMVLERHDRITANDLLMDAVNKVTIGHEQIVIELKMQELIRLLADTGIGGLPQDDIPEIKEIQAAYITRRAHKGSIIIDAHNRDKKDPLDLPGHELKNLIRGLIWRDEHFGGATIRAIATREKLSDGFVGQCIFKTFELA